MKLKILFSDLTSNWNKIRFYSLNIFAILLISAFWGNQESQINNTVLFESNSLDQIDLECALTPATTQNEDGSCPMTGVIDVIKIDDNNGGGFDPGETKYMYIKVLGDVCCGEIMINPKTASSCTYEMFPGPQPNDGALAAVDIVEAGFYNGDCLPPENCDNGNVAYLTNEGQEVTFRGYEWVGDYSYWFYEITSSGANAISHVTFGMLDETTNCCVPEFICIGLEPITEVGCEVPEPLPIEEVFDVTLCGGEEVMMMVDEDADIDCEGGFVFTRYYRLFINDVEVLVCEQDINITLPELTCESPGMIEIQPCETPFGFNDWLLGFDYDGGCNPMVTYYVSIDGDEEVMMTSIAGLTEPDECGGSVAVRMVVEDECGQSTECSSTYIVLPPYKVFITKPEDKIVEACEYFTQVEIDDLFKLWIAEFTVEGGCDPQGDYGMIETPDYCGGEVTVFYEVSDLCFETTIVSATFTVLAPTEVFIYKPIDKTVEGCELFSQEAADKTFALWLSEFTVEGGCDPQGDYGMVEAPPYCGGEVTVNYEVSDLCFETTTVSAVFTILPPPEVIVKTPENKEVSSCEFENQAAVNADFEAWLTGFSVEGGCMPVGDYGAPFAPYFCGGDITVNYTVTDLCYGSEVFSATYKILPPSEVIVNTPQSKTYSACVFPDQEVLNAEFDMWLEGFSVEGGCDPTIDFGMPVAPDLCGGDVTVSYEVTDQCYMTSSGSVTFSILPPPEVKVYIPQFVEVSACDFENQKQVDYAFADWLKGFYVTGGCEPKGDYGTPAPPKLCGGEVIVNYEVTDHCYQTSTFSSVFTILPPPAIEVTGPGDLTVESCNYEDQEALDAAFEEWLAMFNVKGGCKPFGSYGEPIAPDYCAGGDVTVYYEFTDLCASGTVSATFAVQGFVEPPVFVAPLPVDITLGCNDMVPEPAIVMAVDQCGNPITVELEEVIDVNTEFPISFIIYRTWTAMDKCGQYAEPYTQTITQLYCCEDETAFAYQEGNCFIEGNTGRWGWYLSPPKVDGTYEYPLVAAAGLCEFTSDNIVGKVTLTIAGNWLEVEYLVENDPYAEKILSLGDVHFYANCVAPRRFAPGLYGNTTTGIDMGDGSYMATFEIDISRLKCANLYLIAHAVVGICERVAPPVIVQPLSIDNEGIVPDYIQVDQAVQPRTEAVEALNIYAYPNPANDIMNIQLTGLNNYNTTIRITNTLGLVSKVVMVEGVTEYIININTTEELDKGLFYISVTNQSGQKTIPILVL